VGVDGAAHLVPLVVTDSVAAEVHLPPRVKQSRRFAVAPVLADPRAGRFAAGHGWGTRGR
jgi:hypothetical protein